MSRGCDSTEAENEDANSSAPTRSGHRRRTTARDCLFAIKSKLKSSTSALTKKLLIFYIEEGSKFCLLFCWKSSGQVWNKPLFSPEILRKRHAPSHCIQRTDPEKTGFNVPVVNSGLTKTAQEFCPCERDGKEEKTHYGPFMRRHAVVSDSQTKTS
ncbi:hypothetical protein EVAR_21571_1 [Eumeta japonica]|uniref:Uncharacterized protein n=1 Tax=Eumeta variegata TaxID=151549 RepID=A0A4C1XM95_EUMVA|nr:hypothetical protein EVAR_21571_1 [Eumeta japonica]